MRGVSVGLVLALGALSLAGSCALAGFDKGSLEGRSGGGGSVGSTGGGGSGGVDPCASARFPAPPEGADDGGDIAFAAALRTVFFESDDGSPVGIDLDRLDTCRADGPSCIEPASADDLLGDDFHCDLPCGRDNSFGKLLTDELALLVGVDLVETYSKQANAGQWSAIVRVTGYNGEPDDAQVRVEWLQATGFDGTPVWDGTDEWSVSTTSYEVDENGMPDTTKPKHFDDSAYVTDGRLVANISTTPIVLASGVDGASQGYFEVALGGGGLVATLEPAPGGGDRYVLADGVVAGFVSEEALFEAIATYRNDEGEGLCPGDFFYDSGRPLLCAALDSVDSVVGPTTPCNAMSFGIGFESFPVLVAGTAEPIEPSPYECTGGAAPDDAPCDDGAGGGGGAGGAGGT